MDKPSFIGALRRAEMLLLTVGAMTVVFWLKNIFADQGPDGWPGALKSHFVDIVLMVAMCWYACRGGKVSGGILMFGYMSVFLSLIIGIGLAIGVYLGLHPLTEISLIELDRPIFMLVCALVWCGFLLWVLLGSREIRLYQEIRRLGLTPEEAFVRRGRTYGQRPQPSIHAS